MDKRVSAPSTVTGAVDKGNGDDEWFRPSVYDRINIYT
jgi:hypothetical protein